MKRIGGWFLNLKPEHRDKIDEILGLIDCIDKGCIEERFPEIYKFGPE